jgi:hypothetical protein
LFSAGRYAEAEPRLRDRVARRRLSEKPESPLLAGDLDLLGTDLLNQARWTEAEPVLRECLAIREKTMPDDWSRFDAMSRLGGALLGGGRYAAAEPLIVDGYQGMKARDARIPTADRPRLAEAARRVIRLYEAQGQPEKADRWRVKLGLVDLPADVFARP